MAINNEIIVYWNDRTLGEKRYEYYMIIFNFIELLIF